MKILMFVLFGLPVFELSPSPSPVPMAWNEAPTCPPPKAPTGKIIVNDANNRIELDAAGRVQLSPGMKLTTAARMFWASVDESNPLRAEVDRLRAENAKLRSQCGGRK